MGGIGLGASFLLSLLLLRLLLMQLFKRPLSSEGTMAAGGSDEQLELADGVSQTADPEETPGWTGIRKVRSRCAFCCCCCGNGGGPKGHPRPRTWRWERPETETAAEETLGGSASAQVRSSVDCC